MKNNIIIKSILLTVLSVGIFTQSCNNLDLQPLDRVTTNTFYKSIKDFDGAMFASYSSIQDFWGTSTETLGERGAFWQLTLALTDDVVSNDLAGPDGGVRDADNLLIRPSDNNYAAIYTQIYEGILRANLVLDNLGSENSLTAEQKKSLEAEAKFLRAFFHFLAMQMWGTPPVITKVGKDLNSLAAGNSSQADLYAAILGDFKAAFAGLPASWDDGNKGRATKWAAKAFEGKVYVYQKDWPKAISTFEEVISSGGYSLMAKYDDVFAFDLENGSESIFEVQYGGPYSDDNLWVFDDTHSEAFKASQGIGRVWYMEPGGGSDAPGGGLGWYAVSKDLVDTYEPGDERLAVSVYKDGDMFYTRGEAPIPYKPAWTVTGYNIKKYQGPRNNSKSAYSPNNQSSFNNERYYRYAEMLLLYAEALIQTGKTTEAFVQINKIRARAGLKPTTETDALKALKKEKRLELAFEPNRWFDITRWNIGKDIFGAKWDPKYVVFPFPQAEITRSNGLLKQNQGY